jgi:hypothetical protein
MSHDPVARRASARLDSAGIGAAGQPLEDGLSPDPTRNIRALLGTARRLAIAYCQARCRALISVRPLPARSIVGLGGDRARSSNGDLTIGPYTSLAVVPPLNLDD